MSAASEYDAKASSLKWALLDDPLARVECIQHHDPMLTGGGGAHKRVSGI